MYISTSLPNTKKVGKCKPLSLYFSKNHGTANRDMEVLPVLTGNRAGVKDRLAAACGIRPARRSFIPNEWTRLTLVRIGTDNGVVNRRQARIDRDQVSRIPLIQQGCAEFLLKKDAARLLVDHRPHHQPLAVTTDNQVPSLNNGCRTEIALRATGHLPAAFVKLHAQGGVGINVDEIVWSVVAAHDTHTEAGATGSTSLTQPRIGATTQFSTSLLKHQIRGLADFFENPLVTADHFLILPRDLVNFHRVDDHRILRSRLVEFAVFSYGDNGVATPTCFAITTDIQEHVRDGYTKYITVVFHFLRLPVGGVPRFTGMACDKISLSAGYFPALYFALCCWLDARCAGCPHLLNDLGQLVGKSFGDGESNLRSSVVPCRCPVSHIIEIPKNFELPRVGLPNFIRNEFIVGMTELP